MLNTIASELHLAVLLFPREHIPRSGCAQLVSEYQGFVLTLGCCFRRAISTTSLEYTHQNI